MFFERFPVSLVGAMATSPSQDSFRVGWICAIEVEFVVACELLDEEYSDLSFQLPNDKNAYVFGRIGNHKVALACLPKGRYGISSAASVAVDMRRSFPSIQFWLMVGIAGGVPSPQNDIRLGDVVVSLPVGRASGVIHYDYGKTIQNRQFERTGSLNAPPTILLTAIQKLSTLHQRKGHRIKDTADRMIENNPRLRKKFQHPVPDSDILYQSSFAHTGPDQQCTITCFPRSDCTVHRDPRDSDADDPAIHYGLIASADRLMKDAEVRDTLGRSEGVLCFEMESAGLMNDLPCVVIRGICDYADSHKNDAWHGYAATTAAAYAKELLGVMSPTEVAAVALSNSNTTKNSSEVSFTLGIAR